MAGAPVIAALTCRCPNCAKGPLYRGYLKVRETCEVCGFDLSAADSGDGPAVFIILIVGGFVGFLALYSELTFSPPIWLHLVLWLPLTLILSVALMPVFKSVLIAAQFHFKASQARHDD
jgi:uncharacterized protein (DUF983 family)